MTNKQKYILNLLWLCQTEDEVQFVISIFGDDARLVREMIILEAIDSEVQTEDDIKEYVKDLIEDVKH